MGPTSWTAHEQFTVYYKVNIPLVLLLPFVSRMFLFFKWVPLGLDLTESEIWANLIGVPFGFGPELNPRQKISFGSGLGFGFLSLMEYPSNS